MALTYFKAVGKYWSFSGQEAWDDPSSVIPRPISGLVTFIPLLGYGDSINAGTSRLLLLPVRATIKNGRVTRNDQDGCRLVANTEELNLDGELYYRVEFSHLRASNGELLTINQFNLAAPTEGATIDLVAVGP